jgi:fructan beta-fructosidase
MSSAQEAYRPLVHYTSPDDWMNDPNGLIYHDGEYHLFFQYRTPRHWGHAVSTDLMHWETLPVALSPDVNGEIWSGCVVHDRADTTGFFGGKSGLVAVFTHRTPERQAQSIAYSTDNGRTWTMGAENPVLTRETPDFRDPRVFWYAPDNRWIMLVTAGKLLCFYASPNLREWILLSEFASDFTGIWECPDLYPLPVDGDTNCIQWVLQASRILGEGEADVCYFIGTFDGTTFVCEPGYEVALPLSYGPDDYATISFEDVPDGRRILLGWMNRWSYAGKTPTSPWRGAMTFPREAVLQTTPDGIRLRQTPVAERKAYYGETTAYGNSDNNLAPEDHISLPCAGEVELHLARRGSEQETFEIHLLAGEEIAAIVRLSPIENTLSVERPIAAFSPRFGGTFSAPVPISADEPLSLRLILDACSVEIFTEDGALYLPALLFPEPPIDGLTFAGETFAVQHLRVTDFLPSCR